MKRFSIPLAALFSLIAPSLTRAAPPIYPGVVPYEQLDTRNFYLGNYPILRIMPFMPKDTPPYLPVDTWSFAVNTNLWTLYAYDPPNTTWHQVLGLGGIAVTINPTDTVMPYRVDATTFGDSPWSVPGAGQAYADGANAFLHLDLATGNSAYHTTTPNSTLAIYPQMLMEQVPAMGDTVSTTTMAEGMLVSNPTPSTAAAPENSPSMYWGGSAWSTNGAASTPMAFAAVGVPRNAANIPTAYWSLFSSVSNRPPTLEFTVKEGSGYTGLGTSYLSDAGTYTSNLTTWSTYLMYSTVTNLNVWNLTITNGGTINYGGTNIPTINPTISYIPYNLNGTNFADSVMYQSLGAINIADPGLDSELWVRDTAPTSTAKANLGSAETNAWLQLDAGGANATVLLSPNAGSGVPSPFKPFYLHTTYTVSPGVNLFELFNNGTTNFAVDASSGYTGTGSKVLTDNGTYQTASSVITGAISSQLLWTNSPTGGGSLTASSNVIASLPTGLYGSIFNNSEDIFAEGENAGQGQAVIQSTNLYNIGLLSGYGMTGNEAWMVMNIGDAAGRSATIYNSQDVYNFGIAPGELAQITNGSWVVMNIGDNAGYAMVTDKSEDIFNYGWLSGDSMGVSNSVAIFNYGDWAGRNNISVIQNSQEIYNYGYAAGVDQNPRNSTNLYNYGNIAGGVQQAIEVNGYYNYGTDSGWMGVGLASNSEELYNYGAWAGASLAALVADGTFVNFTNVYNYGPEAGMQIKGTNATYILNYGYRAGEQSTMTGVSDLYNYGSDSGFQSTYDTSATDIYNYGTSAGKGASYTNSFFILNSGNSAGQSMVAQDSSSILNLGSYAGANMVATNSSSIVNIGPYAGNLSTLTNSSYVLSYGDQALKAAVLTNSSEVYSYGYQSLYQAQLTNSSQVYAFGDIAGRNVVMTNANDVFAFGVDPLDGANLSDSTYVFAFGNESGSSAVLTNSQNIYSYGYQALYQAKLTNSSQIYAFGDAAMSGFVSTNATDVYAFGYQTFNGASFDTCSFNTAIGDGAGKSMVGVGGGDFHFMGNAAGASVLATNSSDVYGFGYAPFQSSVLDASRDLHGIGDQVLSSAYITGSQGIYAYGYQALRSAKLTNAFSVMAFGNNAGASLAGDGYSDIYLLGDNAQPTRKTNEFGFGSANDLYTFPGHINGDVVNAVNVQKVPFNAKGDGVTDDTAAIQAAIDHLAKGSGYTNSNGGLVWLPRGTYLVSTLNLRSAIRLSGESKEATILVHTNATGDVLSFANTNATTIEDRMSVENLSIIQYPGYPHTSGAAITGTVAPGGSWFGVDLHNIQIYGTCDGVYLSDVIGNAMSGISAFYVTSNAFKINSATKLKCDTLYASHCQRGFDLRFMAYSSLVNSGADVCSDVGYWIQSSPSLTLLSCGTESPQYGFYLYGQKSPTLINCYVNAETSTIHGVVLDGSTNATIVAFNAITNGTPPGYTICATNGATHNHCSIGSAIPFASGLVYGITGFSDFSENGSQRYIGEAINLGSKVIADNPANTWTFNAQTFPLYGLKFYTDSVLGGESVALSAYWGLNLLTGATDPPALSATSTGNLGASVRSPTSTLQMGGSFAESIATGSSFSLTSTNDIYLCNVDAQTVKLPSPIGCRGRNYTIKLIAPATTGTVSTNGAGSDLIDGAGTYSLTASNKFVHVVSDNANWWIIGNN